MAKTQQLTAESSPTCRVCVTLAPYSPLVWRLVLYTEATLETVIDHSPLALPTDCK